jgi:hypothetical protein
MNWLSDQNSFLAWESRSRDTIEVKRCYVDVAGGDLIAGILLSQIIYWHLPDNEGQPRLRIERDGYKWLAKKRDDWWKECRITPKQFDTAIKLLESKNLIVTALYKFGNSPTKHIRIDWENFLELLNLVVQTPPLAPEHIKTQVASGSDEKVNFRKGENGIAEKVKFQKSQSGNAEKVKMELPKRLNLNCRKGENDLIDTEITSEITSEITHNAPLAPPPAPPTQECVCEKEELDLTTKEIELEKPTPEEPTLQQPTLQQPTSLLKKSESSQQTDNPSRGSTIAAGSFDKSEQANNQLVAPNPKSASPTSLPNSICYTIHPTEKTEQAMRESGLPPWMDKAGPNGWKTEFVESYRQYLNSTPRYAKELIRQATTGEAKNALTRLSKSDSGTAEIQNHWDSFNELKERQQHQQQHQPHHSSDDALAKAIADDEERRRFEQQRHSWVPMPQKDAASLKAKLQAAANTPKVPSNSRFDLREVEAQLKLSLRA